MLDLINRKLGNAVSDANRYLSDKGAKPNATVAPTAAAAVYSETTVTVTLSQEAITAAANTATDVPANAAATAANAESLRAQQALNSIVQAKGQAAGITKTLLRQKLEGYKKELQILRLLGTNAMEIAKGAVKVARGVAGAARDYAAATLEEKKAGLDESSSSTESASQAQAEVDSLKAKAAAAPLDAAGSDTPGNAPTDPDQLFFYTAFRILGLAKKTINQAQQVDVAQHGTQHNKDFSKLRKREGELDEAVTKSYVAMMTGGSLKSVDALLNDNSPSSLGSGM